MGERGREAWAAAAIACAPGEGHDLATSQERERQVTAELLEAEATSADLRRVNDVLRAQLAEAQTEAESLRGAEKAADKHVQTLEAQLADVRTFANFEAVKAKDFATQLQSARVQLAELGAPFGCDNTAQELAELRAHYFDTCRLLGEVQAEARATWVTEESGRRRLVVRETLESVAGFVSPERPGEGSIEWEVDRYGAQAEGSCDVDCSADHEQAMCRAQRIVEMVAGVRP
jgi:hypothetical protein